MNHTRETLRAFIDDLPIVSTHEHHHEAGWHEAMTLERVLASSYVEWVAPVPGEAGARKAYLDKVGANAYFVWLSRGLERIYGMPLKAENWDALSAAIAARLRENPLFHVDMLREYAGYEMAIQDTFWNPGSDVGRLGMFVPTFRINHYVVCLNSTMRDHDGNSSWRDGRDPRSLDEYLDRIRQDVAAAKANGAVALKSALAYDRSIAFGPARREAAARAFERSRADVTPGDAIVFGDYVMDCICGLAAEFDLPFQQHTGLGLIAGSNPLGLDHLVRKHPATKFVLFHGGYPWIGECAAMAHNYGNVFLDICWLPLISTSAAIRAVREFMEAGINGHRIAWGGDCQSGEESVGAALAFRHVLTEALAHLIDEGYMTMADAEKMAQGIAHENARALYGL